MKKLLALVLALVMTMSLVTISNAAYSDAADVDYTEAVDVMSAIGVFQGADGKFSPKANLTREQAAKLIAYLDLGAEVAEALPAIKVFNDVEATRWSAKYIAYCADAGYIAGVGDGKFNPEGALTGYAFAKMLFCVLGYDQDVDGLTGSSWQINVAKLLASDKKLAKGVEGLASATLTREAAAQYCLNALKATTVTAHTGSTTTVNGITVTTGGSKATDNGAGNEFYKKFDGLTFTTASTTDALGRTAHKWTYTKKGTSTTYGPYADSADSTFVISKATTVAKYIKDNSIAATDTLKADTTALNVGDIVEFFNNSDGQAATKLVYSYSLAKISKISKAADSAKYDYLVTLTDGITGSFKDTDITGFDTSFAKDDMVVVLRGTSDTTKLVYFAKADVVTGKMTGKETGKVYVDGTKYTYKSGVTAVTSFDDSYNFYLDPNGYVLGAETVSESASAKQYLYLEQAEVYGSGSSLKGDDAAKALAKVLFTDGTEKTVNLQLQKATKAYTTSDSKFDTAVAKDQYYVTKPDGKYAAVVNTSSNKDTTATAYFPAGFYAYTVKNDQYVLSSTLGDTTNKITATTVTEAGKTLVITKDSAAIGGFVSKTANSKTVLTVVNDGVKTYTGIKSFETTTFTIGTADGQIKGYMTLEKNGVVTDIIVIGGAVTSANTWGYITGEGVTDSEGTKYNFYVDGKKVEYYGTSLTKGLHIISVDSKDVATTSGTATYGTVKAVDDTYFQVDGGSIVYFADDCKVYNISGDLAGAEAELSKGDVVAYGTNGSSKVEVVYIIDAPEIKSLTNTTNDVEYVQNGSDIVVSGTKQDLTVKFADSATGATVTVDSADADGVVKYTTDASEDGSIADGIVLYFNISSMT